MTAQPELDLAADALPEAVRATAQAMVELLRRHYLPDDTRPAGIFAPEIQAPGSTRRRADLIWLGCTAATGNHLVGHEIKVSRADVRTELTDLTKSDPWQRYCDRWYLVVPHLSLIEDLELPDSWGVLTPPSGRRTRSMTVHRTAPRLRPVEQSPALRTLAAWQLWQLRDSRAAARDLTRRLQQTELANRELRLSTPHQPDPRREVVGRVIAALGQTDPGSDSVGDWGHEVQVDDVVAALKDLGSVYHRRDDALRTLESIRRTLERYQRLITEVLARPDGSP